MATFDSADSGAHKWTISMDKASNSIGSDTCIILENREGIIIKFSLSVSFPTSNNQEEHEVLLVGLRLAKDLGTQEVKIFIDS